MQRGTIEWTDWTANPLRALRLDDNKRGHHCVHVSPGCINCYAETWNYRRGFGTRLPYDKTSEKQVQLFIDDSEINQLARLNRLVPRLQPSKCGDAGRHMVFMADMTDLFQDAVSDDVLDYLLTRFTEWSNLYIQLLTKRAQRMREVLQKRWDTSPPEHIWVGVSAENQEWYDKRLPELLGTPAFVRYLSLEPILGAIDLHLDYEICDTNETVANRIHQVIIGAESGHNARVAELGWIRDIVEQCKQRSVPVFVKQLNKKDGDFNEWPADLQIRQYPRIRSVYGNWSSIQSI